MADYLPPATPAARPPITAALIVYALFAIAAISGVVSSGLVTFAPLVVIAGIVGVIVAYVKRGEAQGTWVASHFDWLIATFWWSLLWSLIVVVVGGILILVLVGLIIIPVGLAIVSIWVIYRVVRGYLAFNRSEPLPG
ncbi:MAG: hypothetical protein KA200_01710 [Burkholderiales bacterium]|jgi:uncharacterized membrane protein|nr:hypothetical protein [Burkholderiales bacterium]MBP6564306.1 hypothetical protein [Burkholderiales bacterium]